MKKLYFFSLAVIIISLFTFNSFGQNYSTDFENYTIGELLACQDTTNWTTFNLMPCDPVEDAYISTNYAYNGTKSLVILPDDDIVKRFGNLTSGTWHINFDVLFPSGKAGYFNLLSVFDGAASEWAFEVYFTNGGTAIINAGATGAAQFSFQYDDWFNIEIVVNLDSDQAELKLNTNSIYVWQWTLGVNGNGGQLRLEAIDFYGYYPNNEMYVDNFWFGDTPVSVKSEGKIPPETFSLSQNYPNPFNPTTTIRYSIPFVIASETKQSQFVTLKIYDVLGKEVASLVNEYQSAGRYQVEFDASHLPSGFYFYRLQSGSFVDTKKMILLK